jgi:type II secretion system protein G
MIIKTNRKGFTLIELLVVIAIIGLLSTLAVIALSSARTKARDAKRLSDVKQVQIALELYYTDNSRYPIQVEPITLGSSAVTCLHNTDNGWSANCDQDVYMRAVPKDPKAGSQYMYSSADGTAYSIDAALEADMGGLLEGQIVATPSGIRNK